MKENIKKSLSLQKNKQYLNYNKNYDLLKTSENYRILNSNMAQQILKEVDKNFKSFFSLLKLAHTLPPIFELFGGWGQLHTSYRASFATVSPIGNQ